MHFSWIQATTKWMYSHNHQFVELKMLGFCVIVSFGRWFYYVVTTAAEGLWYLVALLSDVYLGQWAPTSPITVFSL